MDGVSTDDTLKIAKSYNDPRIKIYSEPDKGIYDAMNKGIKKSQGEWLYFLGSDDWLIDEKVFCDILEDKNNFDIVYGDVESPRLDKRYKGEWSIDNIEYNRCHQAIFYKRIVFDIVGLYNLKYRLLADFDCNLKCFFDKRIKMSYRKRIVSFYSDGGASSISTDELFERDMYYNILRKGWFVFNKEHKIALLKKLSSQKKRSKKLLEYCVVRFLKAYLRLMPSKD